MLEHSASTVQDQAGLPPEFDPSFYRARLAGLDDLTDAQLRQHYDLHGRAEGRQASVAAARQEFLQMVPHEGRVLEIGPFCWPNIRGPHVRYFDVFDREELVRRAVELGIDPDGVAQIDFVDLEGDLGGIADRFDAVYSSHCIEHTPDLLHHFQQVADLLVEGGRYYLIIPDKRFCFDHYLPESTARQVLAAHEAGRRRHLLESIVDHNALTTHNDPMRHWSGDHSEPAFWSTISDRVLVTIERFRSTPSGYIDSHAWQFTPDSFRAMLRELEAGGHAPLCPERIYDTPYGVNEFTAVLSRRSGSAN